MTKRLLIVYNESNGRGWCKLFNYQARAHHEMTNDCVVNSETAIQQRETSALNINRERPLITIEFAPDIHPEETEYSYEHPQFVFGDRVVLVNSAIQKIEDELNQTSTTE